MLPFCKRFLSEKGGEKEFTCKKKLYQITGGEERGIARCRRRYYNHTTVADINLEISRKEGRGEKKK